MKINLNNYTALIPIAATFINNNPTLDDSELLARLTLLTSAPVIVCCHLILKHRPDSVIIKDRIVILTEFYDYDEVIEFEE